MDRDEDCMECSACLSAVALQLTTIADDLVHTYEKQREDLAIEKTMQHNIFVTFTILSSFLLAVCFG